VARSSSKTIVKFADDTVVLGLISGNNEKADLEEFANLSLWCQDNSLVLNVSKTKELIVDFRRTQQHQRTCTPLGINGTAVERVSSFSPHRRGSDLAKQRLYHLRQLRKFRVSTFYAVRWRIS